MGFFSKAYDWNYLEENHIINDDVGPTKIAIALAEDGSSFVGFERPNQSEGMVQNDTLYFNSEPFDLNGNSLTGSQKKLNKIKCYQEFWHSWKTFHPETEKFPE